MDHHDARLYIGSLYRPPAWRMYLRGLSLRRLRDLAGEPLPAEHAALLTEELRYREPRWWTHWGARDE
ncbi:hypothetical protein [Deinococcus geothermalis]|uniref:hypothetical protein n=1 Tax=Deinococcus geothermalis TaxID=68909 RepID=UPI000051C468|nr:hypothetical protein [Deinococcus geothermalis]